MLDRRDLLKHAATGLSGVALADLLRREEPAVRRPHHAPRATRVVQLFMSGAASQVDMFDYKPELVRSHGKAFDVGEKVELFQSSPGAWMQSPWRFRPRGQCGKHVSDLVPHLAECVDRMAFLHGMVSETNVHGPATFLQATGFARPGFPSAGAWVSHGLGSLTDDLPTFVVLPDARGFAPNGPRNWSAGFLPTQHQGTMLRPDRKEPVFDLRPPQSAGFVTPSSDAEGRRLLAELNALHRRGREDDPRLAARIATYELAARLQLSAPEVLDLSGESPETLQLYGLDREETAEFGRRCLIARRLLERGVRFVQLWSGADNGFPRRNWDSHEDLQRDHADMATSMDRPAAALLVDLERRGMLDDTIVHWTTEFGRMPCSQGGKGRDHNPFGFTNWLAGGGIRGGVSHGATDVWSFRAVEGVTGCHDVYATMLHLLGIDHERLTVRQDGIDRRLTDVGGRVLGEILA